jgi:hypothetical protein
MVLNFEVMSDKFNATTNCTSGNYAQKHITKLYNYLFIVLTGLTIWTEAFYSKCYKFFPELLFTLTITSTANAQIFVTLGNVQVVKTCYQKLSTNINKVKVKLSLCFN